MQAARHQVVHQVVAPRDRMEHVVDQRLLVVERHLAEAEIGLGRLAHRRSSCAGQDHSAAARAALQTLSPTGARATMPELPEVETVRRGLQPAWRARVSSRSKRGGRDLRWPLPKDFVKRLQGKTVTGLGRRAKYLLADLSSGEVLIMHLGMSGSFRVAQRWRRGDARPIPSRALRRSARMTMWSFTCRPARSSPSTIRAASAA